jgi:rare lipoprotein A
MKKFLMGCLFGAISTLGNSQAHKPLVKPSEGLASWYGKREQGRKTSSGERFDRFGLTCASRTLPFNTWIKVRNKTNNRTVIVKVTDRGPQLKSRIVDLSERAADLIGCKSVGVCPVEISLVDTPVMM